MQRPKIFSFVINYYYTIIFIYLFYLFIYLFFFGGFQIVMEI